MTAWDATSYDAKENLLRVVHQQADSFFALAGAPGAWQSPTACPQWQVRDVVGHLIDVTESYFVGFDAARGGPAAADALGVRVMQQLLDEGAKAHRTLSQEAALDRLRGDFGKLMEMCDALGSDEWGGLIVPHKYMGPLPAFFYPVFQLMDYGVHSWDIRNGGGRAHALDGDAADLLVPFMFILWQATADPAVLGLWATGGRREGQQQAEPAEVGIRICTGHNAGTWRVSAGPAGIQFEPGEVVGMPLVLEFDPGSFVLTAFGRSNSGTVRGAAMAADRFLNLFFRI